MTTLIIIGYLAGCVVAYVLSRWTSSDLYPNDEWTWQCNEKALKISLFSYIAVYVIVSEYFKKKRL